LTSLNNERGGGGYRHREGEVKGVRIFADESARFARRGFLKARGTRMILWRQTENSLSCRCGEAKCAVGALRALVGIAEKAKKAA
jgi:hypothetical protein